MTTDRDDASLRRYREANEALEERPSAGARAAILAAAARHVEAKPRAADAPRAMHRRRWPLAAAAAVLLSTLAVMMAQRTEQEMPSFTAPPAAKFREQAAVPPSSAAGSSSPDSDRQGTSIAPATTPPASAPETSAAMAERADVQQRVPDQLTSKKTAPAPSVNGRTPAPSAVSEARNAAPAMAADETKPGVLVSRESEAANAESRDAFPAAPVAAPPPTALARSAPTPSAQGASGTARGAGDTAKPDAANVDRSARREAAPSAMPRAAAPQELARDFERSAQEWLDHIVKLRGEGRHAEADAEVKRFRERYPDMQVPARALAPGATGTR